MARGTGNYYSPQSVNLSAPGVRKESDDFYSATYIGAADALVAAGFATVDMFPGQPGRAATSVTFRPLNGKQPTDASWFHVPGYITITRRSSATFAIRLTEGRLERQQRADEQRRRREDASPQGAQARLFARSAPLPAPHAHLRLVWSAPA